MKNNLLFTATINVVALVFICFMFRAFFNPKNWKHALSFLFFVFFVYHPWLFICLIKISGDVEENPGPKHYSVQYLTIFHRNLKSIAAQNFIKVALLKLTFLSMKWTLYAFLKHILTLLFQLMDHGYMSVRADHPSNKKCKGVLIYYKNFLLIKLIDVKYLHESLNFELRIGGKIFWRKGFCLFIDPLVKTKMILKHFWKTQN